MKKLTVPVKHLLLLLVAGWSWTVAGWAQADALPSLAPTVEENSLLWEISGRGLTQASYLYGTIHMIEKKDFVLTPLTREAFDRAGRIVFEINLEEMNNLALLFSLSQKILMNGDTTLRQLLTTEDYELVQAHFKKQGLPLVVAERMKPMFLAAMGSGDLMNAAQQPGQVVSYEMEFMDMARRQGKPIGGLESMDFQLSLFDSIPYGVQAQMLVQTLRAGDAGDGQFQQLVERYKAQDLQGLQTLLASDESITAFEDLLVGQRNRNWIPVMERLMTAQGTFFAVGAGHLAGDQGVIALLRRQGYSVVPVR